MRVATRAWTPLAGRREEALLELPSVARMVDVLERRCREPSWIRTLVPALDRFATLTGVDDLEALARDVVADFRVFAGRQDYVHLTLGYLSDHRQPVEVAVLDDMAIQAIACRRLALGQIRLGEFDLAESAV